MDRFKVAICDLRWPDQLEVTICDLKSGRSTFKITICDLKDGRGQHRKYAPYAFTEQGVAMLSSVLRSPRAIAVNIEIMRAFVRLRQLLSVHKDLADRLSKLEQQMRGRNADVDQQFRHVFSLLEQLFTPPAGKRRPIGFHASG